MMWKAGENARLGRWPQMRSWGRWKDVWGDRAEPGALKSLQGHSQVIPNSPQLSCFSPANPQLKGFSSPSYWPCPIM